MFRKIHIRSPYAGRGVVGVSACRRAKFEAALLRRWEFDAIAKNVRVGYVFFFDDRGEYLEGDWVVGQPDLRHSILATMDRLGACRKKHHPGGILGV